VRIKGSQETAREMIARYREEVELMIPEIAAPPVG
jgi:hypothetical protein